ncbi:MAG: hypothetical protein OXR66_02290 [Candidatus Woesearchaeota archaeon]|nr:hypothetical protein [Candidatus Woesearchaeota archaeon]
MAVTDGLRPMRRCTRDSLCVDTMTSSERKDMLAQDAESRFDENPSFLQAVYSFVEYAHAASTMPPSNWDTTQSDDTIRSPLRRMAGLCVRGAYNSTIGRVTHR